MEHVGIVLLFLWTMDDAWNTLGFVQIGLWMMHGTRWGLYRLDYG